MVILGRESIQRHRFFPHAVVIIVRICNSAYLRCPGSSVHSHVPYFLWQLAIIGPLRHRCLESCNQKLQ